MLKAIARKALASLGYEVRWRPVQRSSAAHVGIEWDITPVQKLAIPAATVIDVGAAGGTPPLHKLFPSAYFYLIEPLEEFVPRLQALLDGQQGEIITSAAGDAPGEVTMNVNSKIPTRSSLCDRVGRTHETHARTIRVETLDSLLAGKPIDSPAVLKIDVEGFEQNVLRGARTTLGRVQTVIIEVSGDDRYSHLHGNYRIVDDLLREAGFGLENVINATVNCRTTEVHKCDLLYTRRHQAL